LGKRIGSGSKQPINISGVGSCTVSGVKKVFLTSGVRQPLFYTILTALKATQGSRNATSLMHSIKPKAVACRHTTIGPR